MIDETESAPLLRERPPLNWRIKLLYGLGGLGYYGGNLLVGFFFQTFLLEVARLEPVYVGLVLLFGQLTDLITTPIIGKFSDNLNTRFGRRRPLMFLAALPYSVLYFFTWNIFFRDQSQLFIYVSTLFIMWNAIGNVISVPFNALAPDLTGGYDEATDLINVRVIMEIVFGVLVAFLQSLLIETFFESGSEEPDYQKGYFVATIIFSGLFAIFPMISSYFLRERERSAKEMSADTQVGFLKNVQDLLQTFRSRNYVMLMIMYLCSFTSVALVPLDPFASFFNRLYELFIQNSLFLYTKYILERESKFMYIITEVQSLLSLSALLLSQSIHIQVFAALFVLFWSQVTKIVGKKWTYMIGISQFILVLVAFFFLDHSTPEWIIYICAGVAGAGLSVVLLIPNTMLPDIVDEDECINKVRREGAFYSIIVLLQKLGLATALASSSWILGAQGYVAPIPNDPAPDSQPPSAKLALRVICGPIAIALVVLSMIPMFFYQLDKKQVQTYHTKLSERKRALAADPQDSVDQVGIFDVDEVWS